MRLIRFEADKIHGFLNFDINFNKDITFLTGINGSGKTTALNSIAAMLAPDLSVLGNLNYSTMKLTLSVDDKEKWIKVTKSDKYFEILTSEAEQSLRVGEYIPDLDTNASQQSSAEASYYREIVSAYSSHSALSFILSMRSPMFLGLDRRSKNEDEFVRRYSPMRTNRAYKNVFSNSLSASLRAAARLAEDDRRNALIAAGRVAEDMQREILLGLLHFDVEGTSAFYNISAPTTKDISEIESLKKLTNTLPQILKISKEEVDRSILPLFDRLQELLSVIPPGKSAESILSSKPDGKVINALMAWSGSQSQIKKIRNLQTTVAKYNRRRARFLEQSTKYLTLINKFLQDSYKTVVFDEVGVIGVQIKGLSGETKDIAALSSGEAQIFVIITQLAFNKLAASDNVFIIDEPELSLHVDWQEIFVESIQAANPDVQFILASHSPSIILDRVEKCVDLTPLKPESII